MAKKTHQAKNAIRSCSNQRIKEASNDFLEFPEVLDNTNETVDESIFDLPAALDNSSEDSSIFSKLLQAFNPSSLAMVYENPFEPTPLAERCNPWVDESTSHRSLMN